nr:MAG TPA_asm: hypothetical protein [Caudoviricetes sp.]
MLQHDFMASLYSDDSEYNTVVKQDKQNFYEAAKEYRL